MTQPPEWFRAGLKRRIAEMDGTTLESKLILRGLVVMQANMVLSGEGGDAVDEFLGGDLTELFSIMSEDDRNTIRRLAHMDDEETS